MKRLTTGTMTNPASIAITPQFIGDLIIAGNMLLLSILSIMMPQPKMNEVHAAAFVVFFQYSANKNGARNAPARAPHEIPIICAINVFLLEYWKIAITEEMTTNTTTKILMKRS